MNHFWYCCEKCDENVDDLKVNLESNIAAFVHPA